MSSIISGSIDDATLLLFEQTFFPLAQQNQSKLMGSAGVRYVPVRGKSNMSRIGKVELVDITGQRNPDKQYKEMDNDNRKSKTKRFTVTEQVDNYDAAIKLITDPTSALITQLISAKNRVADREIVNACVDTVTVGGPEETGTEVSAADDGVITIDGTSNFDYANVITESMKRFQNNEVFENSYSLALSANEEYSLLQDEKFINDRYTGANPRPVDTTKLNSAGAFEIVTFAGSDTGIVTVENPILPESGGTRTCIIMASNAISYGLDVTRLDVEKASGKVNSWDITIEVVIKTMRNEGVRVQKVSSTI